MKTFVPFSILLLSTALAACAPADDKGQGAGKDPKTAPDITATRVEAATVSASSASIRIVRPGEVEPAKEANVAAALGGFIEKLSIEQGDTVTEGQTVAKVDTSLQSANKALIRVELQDAERELKRLKKMGSTVAQVRVDAAKTRVARAKAQLRIASIQTSRTLIKAPFSGVVADLNMEAGEVAPPGGRIARIVKLDPAKISVSVSDRDVGSLMVNGTASVTAGGLSSGIEGTITQIDPTADLKTRSFLVEVEVPNADGRFKPGMIASVDFNQTVAEEKIIIPQEFLVTKLHENGVFIVDDDSVARWRPLELGALVRDQIVVEKGLSAGDNIVILGHRTLADGDKLILARQGECCTNGRVVFPNPTTSNAVAVADTEAN